MQEGFLLTLDYFTIGHASNPHFRQEAANASTGFKENCCLRRSFHEECPLNHLTCTPPTRSSMFRIAFIIGLILTAFSRYSKSIAATAGGQEESRRQLHQERQTDHWPL